MGVSIRPATVADLLGMQRCNLLCLPENYQLKVSLRSASCDLTCLSLHATSVRKCMSMFRHDTPDTFYELYSITSITF